MAEFVMGRANMSIYPNDSLVGIIDDSDPQKKLPSKYQELFLYLKNCRRTVRVYHL